MARKPGLRIRHRSPSQSAAAGGLIYRAFRARLDLRTWADRRSTFERVAASLGPAAGLTGMPSPSTHLIAASVDRHKGCR
jgi:hypothetical protein